MITAGVLSGALAGFLYQHYSGCNSGCLITSHPVNATLYGAVTGGLFISLFRKEKTNQPE